MKLLFATHNIHKLHEIRSLLDQRFELISLADIGFHEDIAETGETLPENASLKSHYIYNHFHITCFADDSGLEVEALNGAPGVRSARYAGEPKDDKANIGLLLKNMEPKSNRKARFRTVISFIMNGQEHLFEGIVNGEIIQNERGANGFGYDPVFVPEGESRTFAEMELSEKNTMSHRARALKQMIGFLEQHR